MDISIIATIAFTLIPAAFLLALVLVAAPAVRAAKSEAKDKA